MSPRFLLDSNILSEPLRPTPDPGVMGAIQRHTSRLATASTVWSELVYGVERLPPSKRRDAIEEYLGALFASDLEILPYDTEAAIWHGRERARLQGIGRPRPFADGQIAAVARRFDLMLVTRNTRDFEPFAGIRVVNWFSGGS